MRSNWPYGVVDTWLTKSASKPSNTGGIYASQGCTRATGFGGNQPICPQTAWTAAVPAMNAQAVRDFLPDGLPSAVRNAAMLPSSVLSTYLQGVQRQHEQQQQLDLQMRISASASSTAADPIVSPPHPGSYGAVGSTPQRTSCQGSSSRSVDVSNDVPQLYSAGPATPLRITADSIMSSPLPAATTAPAPAPAASAAPPARDIVSDRAPAAVRSFVGTNSSKQMMPLIDYIECRLMDHTQQRLSPEELAEADAASQESLRQWIRQLMRADSLQTHQDVYMWLNKHLTGIQIRTEVGAKIIDYKGVAYLNPLPPANIYHKPTAAASMAAAQAPSPLPQAAAAAEAASGLSISCEQHLLQEYNIVLQHPELPCLAFKLGTKACQEQELTLREQFIHYPLELCSVLLAQSGEPKRGLPCDPWPETVLEGISTSSGAAYKACVPQWVADDLNKSHLRSVRAATALHAAATAAATDVGPAPPTTAPASSSVWASAGSSDQQSTPQLLHDRSHSSTNPQYRSPALTHRAEATFALPSAGYGSAASALPAADGIAVQNTQRPAAVAEGFAFLATDKDGGDDSTYSSRCSTPDLPATARAAVNHAVSCPKQEVPHSPASSTTTSSSSSSKVVRLLSDVAEEFLKLNYPAAHAHCQLLHAEALQSPEHQAVYVALHQTLVGLKVRVHFGNSVRNTRDLKSGVAYLDPRPPRHIMHTNHDQVVVRSADGTESTPQLISVQDYLFHKHGVKLQQPEWPCIGNQRSHSACKDTPDQQDWFMTYPLELCSAHVKDNGELRRGPTCHWESVPVYAISSPSTGRTATAPIPPWIADLLNKRIMEHMTAVSPMHTRQHTQQYTTDKLQPAGVTIPATAQRIPGAAGLHSLSHLAPAGPAGSAAAATEPITAVGTHGCAEPAAVQSAGQQPHTGDDLSSRSNHSEHDGRVNAPPIVMDPSAAGFMLAACLQHLQLTAGPSSQNTSASPALQQPQAGTAALAANPAASMASCPSSSASNSTPATVSDWTQGIDSACITSHSSSSSSSNRSTRPSLQPSSKRGGNSSNGRVHVTRGLASLLSQLLPTKQQKAAKASAVDAVCKAVQFGISETLKMEWQIVEVHQAGSFAKGTSLNGSSDLDILAKIKCHNNAPFHRCRKAFLGAVTRHLCRPPDSSALPAECGWQLRDCHSRYFVKLEHPVLHLQLDIQVAEHFGPKPIQKEQLLTPLLNSVRQQEATSDSEASGVRRDSSTPSVAASVTGKGGRDMYSDRQRVTNLTELMTDVVKKVEQRSRDAHNVHGMGRLCTDIIRLMKAWSKHGLPKALAAAGQPTLPADASKGPPGYIWEIFVVYVLEQGLKRGKRYHQADPLELLRDVLSSASKQLRSSMLKSEAIILEIFYTYEQAMQFSKEWGDDGCPYAPYIISPVDPTYNCTENAAFRDYDALADAAETLHESLLTAITHRKADGWQWLRENSTLGPVVNAYPGQ